jgi:formylglycine-generating enzyme required for sulfatase activity
MASATTPAGETGVVAYQPSREKVSWFEATAFGAWLESRLRARGELSAEWTLRLPIEQEWEKAARGREGLEYPWGERYESGRANIDETVGKTGPYCLRQTSAVGIYPGGASPYEVHDMTGNVWEWCADAVDAKDKSEKVRRVLRGGFWLFDHYYSRATARLGYDPDFRNLNFGFRVVCVSPIR